MKVKCDHRSNFSNLSNWKEEAWKKNQGFNGIRTRDLRNTGAMLYQLSYEATHWERGQFIEFVSPVRSDMMRSIYEIIHILSTVVDESEEWLAQLIFQFKQLKKSGLQRDSNPRPPRHRCDALPTELWSHTSGARSIYWVRISREEWNDVKYVWNNSYLNCGCRWRWRMIIAVNFPI